MSDDEIRQEMDDMRKPRNSAQVEKRAPASDKAQAAREARQAKMANKPASDQPTTVETTEPAVTEPVAESAAPATTFIAEHTVASGDTLSHIAQKYYNSAARDKWMAIYEANKETIGDNPSLIRVGQVLKIPQLPA